MIGLNGIVASSVTYVIGISIFLGIGIYFQKFNIRYMCIFVTRSRALLIESLKVNNHPLFTQNLAA